jgi:hypothetical protein
MDTPNDLEAMEREAYRSSYSDGIIDIFVGLSLVVIGAIWVWAEDYGGLAGILPAIMAPTVIPLRKQIVEARGGYVRWTARRRRWERRNLWGAFGAGVATLLLGIVAYFMAEGSAPGRDLLADVAPGLLAFILAVVAIILAMMLESWRFFVYAAALIGGGLLAVADELNPGWPLLLAGIVVTIAGTVMLTRYLRANPVVDR